MRFATWNINGLRARIDFLLHWLRERQPDVVGIQEIKVTDEQFPHDVFEAAGYRAVVCGQKAWNGVSILSREAAELRQCGLPGGDEHGARLITAAITGITYTTIYCPNGKSVLHEDFPRKLRWLDDLRAHLGEQCDVSKPILVGGDFNICPEPIDSWNEAALAGRIFHTPEERSRFRALLDLGFVDVFRHYKPDAQEFSWWDYRAGSFHKRQGLRIDFMLATPPLLERVRSVEIDRDYRKKKDGLIPSDHAPVIVDII